MRYRKCLEGGVEASELGFGPRKRDEFWVGGRL